MLRFGLREAIHKVLRPGVREARRSGGGAAWTPDSWGTDRLVDYTADDVLTSGTAVTAWVDQLGVNNATQANAANQGELIASHAALGGAAVVRMVSPDYYLGTDYVGVTYKAAGDFGIFARLDYQGSMAQTYEWLLFDATVIDGAMLEAFNNTGKLGIYDKAGPAYRAFSGAAGLSNGAQSIVWDFQPPSSEGFVNAVSVGTGAYGGVVWNRKIAIGSTTAPSTISDAYINRITLLDRTVAAADRSNWHGWAI